MRPKRLKTYKGFFILSNYKLKCVEACLIPKQAFFLYICKGLILRDMDLRSCFLLNMAIRHTDLHKMVPLWIIFGFFRGFEGVRLIRRSSLHSVLSCIWFKDDDV